MENLKGETNMEIVFLVGALMLCVGVLIGMFMDEKINKSYYLGMIDVVENSLKRHNEIYDEYYKNHPDSRSDSGARRRNGQK